MINLRSFLRIARPPFLILAALADALGAGISRYLGKPLNLLVFGLGLLITVALQITAFLLLETFRLPLTPLAQGETLRDREQFRIFYLKAPARPWRSQLPRWCHCFTSICSRCRLP